MSEAWKPVLGYEEDYEVSSCGRVRRISETRNGSHKREALIPGVRNRGKNGNYLQVVLCKKGEMKYAAIHHLVLDAFVGPRPEGAECDHIDGNPSNNCVDNLRWVTKSGNMQARARFYGGAPWHRGEKNPCAKLTNEQARRLRKEAKSMNCSRAAWARLAAARLGVCADTVVRVLRNKGFVEV